MTMTNNLRTETRVGALEENQSAVSWAAIAAGGVATAALTLLLLAFGAGMGFSAISPWSNAGISSETFSLAAGIYLIVVAMLASTIGGYVAGRLRTKWVGVHSDEVAFRDTAHGFLAWAFAAVLGSALLGTAATYLVGGAAQGAAQGVSQGAVASQSAGGANEYFVDLLLRPNPTGQSTPAPQGASDVTVRRGSRTHLHAKSAGAEPFCCGSHLFGAARVLTRGRRSGRGGQASGRRAQSSENCRGRGAQRRRQNRSLADRGHARRRICGEPRRRRGRAAAGWPLARRHRRKTLPNRTNYNLGRPPWVISCCG